MEDIEMDFNQIAVEARRNGTPCTETSELLFAANNNATVDEVVFAFAVSGYPAFDNVLGTRSYFIKKMGFLDAELDGLMLKKLREVKYPENEIQEAFNRVVG